MLNPSSANDRIKKASWLADSVYTMHALHAGLHDDVLPWLSTDALVVICPAVLVLTALLMRSDSSLHRLTVAGFFLIRGALPGGRHAGPKHSEAPVNRVS